MKRNKGNSDIWTLLIIGLIIWFIFFRGSKEDHQKDCIEPENPYNYGSGHYAGYEWGENGNFCSGNSDSFIEGCENYQFQEEIYETCLDN